MFGKINLVLVLFTFLCVESAVVPKKEADFDEKVAVIVPSKTEAPEISNETIPDEKSDDANAGDMEDATKPTTDITKEESTPAPPFKNIPQDTLPILEKFLSGDFWNEPPFSIIASDDLDELSKSANNEEDTKKIMEDAYREIEDLLKLIF